MDVKFFECVNRAEYWAETAAGVEGDAGKRYAMVAQTYATLALAYANKPDEG